MTQMRPAPLGNGGAGDADLFTELRAAADRVGAFHLGWLVRLGVSWSTIDDLSAWGDVPFGIATGSVVDRLFEPGPGSAHIVQPVTDGRALVDLVYWRSADPTSWRLRTGLGAWLGDLDALVDSTIDAPVPLYATPLDWLCAGGDGLCVVNWSASELDQLLRLPSIIAPDAGIAEALRRALVRPMALPEITVAGEIRRAA